MIFSMNDYSYEIEDDTVMHKHYILHNINYRTYIILLIEMVYLKYGLAK